MIGRLRHRLTLQRRTERTGTYAVHEDRADVPLRQIPYRLEAMAYAPRHIGTGWLAEPGQGVSPARGVG